MHMNLVYSRIIRRREPIQEYEMNIQQDIDYLNSEKNFREHIGGANPWWKKDTEKIQIFSLCC